MKKIIILVFLFLVTLVGCNNTPNNNNNLEDIPPIQENPNEEENPEEKPNEEGKTPENDDVEDNTTNTNLYGELIIPNLTIYSGFPDIPQPKFTNEEYACEITYNVMYSAIVTYKDGYFYASGEGSALVEATTQYHSTIFVVEAKSYQSVRGEQQTKNFLNRIEKVEEKWLKEKVTGGTLFIGDSFFDEYQFFTNFYNLYKGQNAYCHGISSSRIEDWFVFSKRLVYPVNPSNIVLHLGTNDMFSGKEDPFDMFEELKTLFDEYLTRLPDVNIYWFAIEPRTYGINGGTFDRYSHDNIVVMNRLMKEYCEEQQQIHYVDVSDKCYLTGINVNSAFFSDGVHPKVENYILYCEALIEAGMNVGINKPDSTTESLSYAIDSTVSSSAQNIRKNDIVVSSNCSIKGEIVMLESGKNPHLEFAFDSSHYDNRLLIWDQDQNGVFTLGYALNEQHYKDVNNTKINLNNSFTFEIVITNKHAYLYIDGVLQIVYRNVNAKVFTISSANTKAEITNIEIIISSETNQWNNVFSREEINTQEKNTSTVKEVIVM